MKAPKIDSIRADIITLLQRDFPSHRANSELKIHWSEVEKTYKAESIFKKTTIQRYLGLINDNNTRNSSKYENLTSLQRIKSILEGSFRKHQEDIRLTSSNTTNFQGFYLILSPSSVDGMLNLFPLEIFPNGDFELNYVHYGDIIRGITSFSTNHISLYANRKFNTTMQSHIPFFLHSVFNVQSSSSRNDLKPFSLGVATRRKRNTDGLKAVMEILVKIEKPMFDAFEGTALTLEKDTENNRIYLLRGIKDYLDDSATAKFLQYKVEVAATTAKGKVTLIEKELREIVNEFYDFLMIVSTIQFDEDVFNHLMAIEKRLKSPTE